MALQQAVGETNRHKYCYIQGVHVAVAAGNSFVNACQITPAGAVDA